MPTSEILTGLRDLNWVPVEVEEQRIRQEARRGFQKHLIRLRLESQMATLDEWNVELVVVNSHDAATSKSEAEAAAQRQGLRECFAGGHLRGHRRPIAMRAEGIESSR
ncbi:MAG TPA: DUF932 domain-containing protein [Verrucomicrobiota bacterium]|nr:DUF932 domain-containing protein [Verrucomicrobiota bacterium]HRZ36612.1 DUF932 domain-containing protein [Candidatus Paceibacterota bacterium]HRZ56115.1 DUF932 domain-containing protein [Candidatus Paceibacterota bacterium]